MNEFSDVNLTFQLYSSFERIQVRLWAHSMKKYVFNLKIESIAKEQNKKEFKKFFFYRDKKPHRHH